MDLLASATGWTLRASCFLLPMCRLPALLAVMLTAAGCSVFIDDDRDLGAFGSYEMYQAERQAAVADLDRLIGDAEASGLAACQTVPVGAKACGGPTDYAVYSAEASEAAAIVQTAEEITQLDEQANREFDLTSDCAVTPEPTVVWAGGQCQAESGRASDPFE